MIPPSSFDSDDRITVEISRDLEDIVPIFLANRKKELPILRDALTTQGPLALQRIVGARRERADAGVDAHDRVGQRRPAPLVRGERGEHEVVGPAPRGPMVTVAPRSLTEV